MKVFVLIALLALVASETCPDSTSCPNSTCCPLENGGYGCCPYVGATCCEDKAHCCPNGYTCDLRRGRCVQSTGNDFLAYVGLMQTYTPSIEGNWIKCIKDLIPFVKDVQELINDIKAGNFSAVLAVVKRLIAEGVQISEDCKNLF